ncbi:unnamed protein product [Leptosia nina]|uniref:Uncharacterized protein n=1 Tax=Leptosia nina TaxID=320188 RepID=A0AAV1J869_9NEOP
MPRPIFAFVLAILLVGPSYAGKRVVRSPQFGLGFGGGYGGGFGGGFGGSLYPHPPPPPFFGPHFYHPVPPPPPPGFGYGLSGYGHGYPGGYYPGGFGHGYYPGGLGGGLSIAKSVSISSGLGGAQSNSEAFG